MAVMDGPNHLLSLKVMRISRPQLASAWQPFYSSSPSFSAHSTASVLSLQGSTPLPGHPKTLRDLTHASDLLTLPSSFGSIQLGETFSSCLCINNETNVDIENVTMKIEMQTVTTKVLLTESGGPKFRLAAGDTLESVVDHEIKELGQHVLACTVTYRSPPNMRTMSEATSDEIGDPNIQVFRKFYKFAVTNPLSVKTKVHTPRSPSALLSPAERDKVFLEVHIQNLTQEPIYFERMRFECTDNWDVIDGNVMDVDDDNGKDVSIFSGSSALMQPQDMRQYMYIINPKILNSVPTTYQPGSIIPLGRLDISWRSSFGEPGRLLTSMLSRRIPLPPVPIQQPASALPSYLKRTVAGPTSSPSRPHSPQLVQSRPSTPPLIHRPASPSLSRSFSLGPAHPQSPIQLTSPVSASELEVNMIVRHLPRNLVTIEKPFTIRFNLIVSASLGGIQERRILTLAVQHVQPPRATSLSQTAPAPLDPLSPRMPTSGVTTPPSATTTFNYALAHQKLLVASPRQPVMDVIDSEQDQIATNSDILKLPAPYFQSTDDNVKLRQPGVVFAGSSTLLLPTVELSLSSTENPVQKDTLSAGQMTKVHSSQDFELTYIPLQQGFHRIGGLRVLLLDNQVVPEGPGNDIREGKRKQIHAQVLKEWDVIGEVWVSA